MNIPYSALIVLAVVLTALKLSGVVSWPWVWVLSPLWLPFAVVTAVVLFWMLVVVLIAVGALAIAAGLVALEAVSGKMIQ